MISYLNFYKRFIIVLCCLVVRGELFWELGLFFYLNFEAGSVLFLVHHYPYELPIDFLISASHNMGEGVVGMTETCHYI